MSKPLYATSMNLPLMCLAFVWILSANGLFQDTSSDVQVCANLPSGTLVADRSNCSRFYTCVYGRSVLRSCALGTWFDASLGICNHIGSFDAQTRAGCTASIEGGNDKTFENDHPNNKEVFTATLKWIGWKPSDNSLPGKIAMELPLGRGVARLELVKKENYTSNIKVVSSLRGKYEEWKSNKSEEWSVYSDLKANATMSVVTKMVDGTRTVQYSGIFKSNGTRYRIEPDSEIRARPVDERSASIVLLNDTRHLMSAEDAPRNSIDFRGMPSGDADSVRSDLERLISGGEDRQNTSGKKSYGIELLVVIDYSIYYKWYARSSAASETAKAAEAISNIVHFYTHIVNGINDRYTSIRDDEAGFYVRVSGYSIAQVPEDSQFTEMRGIKIEGDYAIFVYKALDQFEVWIKNESSRIGSKLPSFDSAVLFTDYEMRVENRTITGLANIGTTCTFKGVSINKDHGQYATIETAAHELGHNLGAQHDGHENGCQSADQYVMANSPGQLNSSTFYNPYTFSTCSINYFKDYARKLDRSNNNCLLNTAVNRDSNFNDRLKTLPGQRYDADSQCQLLFGKSSFYCAGGGDRDNLLCKELRCWNPKISDCFSKIEQRALEGTKCGDGAWCIRGACEKNDKAPKAPATCIYGDYKAKFHLDDENVTCEWMAKNRPDRCYEKHYNDLCCASCAAAADPKFPGCEWGDKYHSTCSTVKSDTCYNPSWRGYCCATCRKLEIDVPGASNCRYGDKTDCRIVTTDRLCYSYEDVCCLTCSRLKSNISGCEYGDKASNCNKDHCLYSVYWDQCCHTCRDHIARSIDPKTTSTISMPTPSTSTKAPVASDCPHGDQANWCTTVSGADCYAANATCCMSCKKFYRAENAGCQYGDRASWCQSRVKSAQDCRDANVASTCCYSCQDYKSNHSVLPACTKGDQSDYCKRMNSWECYGLLDTCCQTCSRHYDPSISNCEYGDKADWCRTYVRGPEECKRPEVADNCCKTCSMMNKRKGPLLLCKDEADWCPGMFKGFCYDFNVRSKCCSTCATIMENKPEHCLYGDRYNWCSKEFCSMNSVECCESCAK